jgi:hypothetical protein
VVSNRLAALGVSAFVGAEATGIVAGVLGDSAGSFFAVWLPNFFRASALAAFDASSISALARSSEFFKSRWLETKWRRVWGSSLSRSSMVPVTLTGVVRASFSPSVIFFGITFTRNRSPST